MSLNGSGHFTRRRDSDHNSSDSQHTNFSSVERVPPTTYEPGSGAEFMVRSGWNLRDAYGKPRPGLQHSNQQPHQIGFGKSPDYKKIYLIALIIVSILLLSLIVLFIILFSMKVCAFSASSSSTSVQSRHSPMPGQSSTATMPAPRPPIPAPAPKPATLNEEFEEKNGWPNGNIDNHLGNIKTGNEGADKGSGNTQLAPFDNEKKPKLPIEEAKKNLELRSFECNFQILDQANPSYNDPESFEYNQAIQIVQNAVSSAFEQSTLKDAKPIANVVKVENKQNDLLVVFRLTVTVPSNNSIRADAIRNVIFAEVTYLEGVLNHITIDKTKIAVKMIM